MLLVGWIVGGVQLLHIVPTLRLYMCVCVCDDRYLPDHHSPHSAAHFKEISSGMGSRKQQEERKGTTITARAISAL